MNTCTPDLLHQHANAIDHAAAIGGYKDDRTGQRVTLDQSKRAQWARDAALLREQALSMEPHANDGQ